MIDKLNLRKYCHVNTNNKGDRFVGLKRKSDGLVVCFPIGYQLPEGDTVLRRDILHLFQVLKEFIKGSNKSFATKNFCNLGPSEFPVNTYLAIISDYMKNGYYTERDFVYATGDHGTIDWSRTIQQQSVFVQEDLSPVYTQYAIRKSIVNENKLITQIHMYCVYESFVKLGWLFTQYMPCKPVDRLDVKRAIAVLTNKLHKTNDHKNKRLFRSMLDVLTHVNEASTEKQFCFGTEHFELVWERLIDRVFGIKNKQDYFPRTTWILVYREKHKKNFPLMPDSIMIWNDKVYILDAKYYSYGVTRNPYHLPDSSSINKQITYGEYVYNNHQVPDGSLFNAFLMPYNAENNRFGTHDVFTNIGMTVGDWKLNTHDYEKIQGILVDIRYLMYHYTGNSKNNIVALGQCIENALSINNKL